MLDGSHSETQRAGNEGSVCVHAYMLDIHFNKVTLNSIFNYKQHSFIIIPVAQSFVKVERDQRINVTP